jgi:hypothetical protein
MSDASYRTVMRAIEFLDEYAGPNVNVLRGQLGWQDGDHVEPGVAVEAIGEIAAQIEPLIEKRIVEGIADDHWLKTRIAELEQMVSGLERYSDRLRAENNALQSQRRELVRDLALAQVALRPQATNGEIVEAVVGVVYERDEATRLRRDVCFLVGINSRDDDAHWRLVEAVQELLRRGSRSPAPMDPWEHDAAEREAIKQEPRSCWTRLRHPDV